LLDDLDIIAERVTAMIRASLPAYEAIAEDEHRASVAEQISLALLGIREGRTPSPADLTKAELLGRRRAEQGIAVSVLLQAYELPFQELWACYVAEAHGSAQSAELIALAPALMAWLHNIGGAAADGHQIVAASQLADRVQLQSELLHVIESDPLSSHAATLTIQLGLEPAGSFVAIAFVPTAGERELARLGMRLQLNVGGVVAAPHDSLFVVLQQNDRTEAVRRLCRPYASEGVLGVGQRRSTLDGARLSIGDARRAIGLARRMGRDVEFSEHWWLASVIDAADHIDGLEAAIRVAANNPHLSSTVLAFADNGFSATATARALHLHPNSVTYRLERWTRLTGWRLGEFEGVARSMVAILLAASTDATPGTGNPPLG
jgi:PucR C-terminal helix-turn-helix domain/GGDEF-like domain